MSDVLKSNVTPFLAELGPYDEDVLSVVRFKLVERMSRPFELHLELASRRDDLDFDAVVGEKAVLTLRGAAGDRYVHGVVTEFEAGDSTEQHHYYLAVVRPRLWLLSQRRNCRMFQQLKLDAIVRAVLAEHKLSDGVDFKLDLKGDHPAREYCVQYRESDLAFVSRLLEEEGVHYHFSSTPERSTLAFGDHQGAVKPIDGDPEIRMAPPSGMISDLALEQVFDARVSQRVRPGAFASCDYEFKQPDLDLVVSKAAAKHTELEVFDYPGEYRDKGLGESLAEIRLDEQQSSRKEIRGRSNCMRFYPGAKFELTEHARSDFNGEYLIVEIRHRGASPQSLEEGFSTGGEAQYANEFVAIPADVCYRPPRETARPVVRGAQPAIVCGPAGEEIYCDEYGRVKVRFYWDRQSSGDQSSSCWIRASQAWADGGWGAMAIPRIGQEVLIDFMEGDPDQPVIVGRLYNGTKMPPNSLPGEKSKMTIRSQSLGGSGGSNEITMDDTGGTEHFFVHAQYDLTQIVEHDRVRQVGNNEVIAIGRDRTDTVGDNEVRSVAANRTRTVGDNETVTIGSSYSRTVGVNETVSVAVARTHVVGANDSQTVAGAQEIIVGAARAVAVGGAQVVSIGASLSENVGSNHSLKVGGDDSTEVDGDYKLEVKKASKTLVKKELLISSKEQITFKAGKASITLKKDGTILIKGKDIQIKASGKLDAKASSKVTIKGSEVASN